MSGTSRTLVSILVFCAVAVAGRSAVIAAQPQSTGTAAAPAVNVININTASAKDLEGLPGIGQKVAARIVEYRQKNGPFKKVEDLMNVGGIGEKSFLKLKPQITVAAKAESPKQ